MAIVSSIIVSSLVVAGVMDGDKVVPEPYNFFDPLGYTTYNLMYDKEFIYSQFIEECINNKKIMSSSNVTVLTKGMGAKADDWLIKRGDNLYEINDIQLPYQLCKANRIDENGEIIKNENINIYKFYLDNVIHVEKLVENNNYYSFINLNSNESINLDSQIVLLYDGDMGYGNVAKTNQEIYENFKEALNCLLTDIANNQYGYISKVNLIGHSRGGLINMLYSIDYPEIVNNLISLGTPYMGSDWAKAYVSLMKIINGPENVQGYDDMLDENHINDYSIFFNTQANNVNSLAIGFYQTNTYFTNTIIQYFTGNADGIDELAQLLSNSTGGHITKDQFITILNNLQGALTNLISLLIDDSKFGKIFDAITFTSNVLAELEKEKDGYLTAFSNFLNSLGSALENDVLVNINHKDIESINTDSAVNLDSQLGYERNTTKEKFKFKNRKSILLGDENNRYYYDENHCSEPDNAWIGHNFETKNPTAINYILEHLNENKGFHEHSLSWKEDKSTHTKVCSCGMQLPIENNNNMQATSIDKTTHRLNCNNIGCDYYYIEMHKFTFYNNITNHTSRCSICGYSFSAEHVYNVYMAKSLTHHVAKCLCGAEGSTSPHNKSFLENACSQCKMPMGSGGSIIPPPGGGTIITPPIKKP